MKTQHWLEEFPMNHLQGSKDHVLANSYQEYYILNRKDVWQCWSYYSEKELWEDCIGV